MTVKVILFQLLLGLNTFEIQVIMYQIWESQTDVGRCCYHLFSELCLKSGCSSFWPNGQSHHVPRPSVTSAPWQGRNSYLGCASSEGFKPWEGKGK